MEIREPPTVIKTVYPVSREEAKTHCEIETSDEANDGYIDRLIKAATRQCENYVGKDLAVTTSSINLYNFTGNFIKLYEGNVISVEHVISDASVSLAVSGYKYFDNWFEVYLSNSTSYTTDYTPLKVEYTSGY